jgi:hypothetical protein
VFPKKALGVGSVGKLDIPLFQLVKTQVNTFIPYRLCHLYSFMLNSLVLLSLEFGVCAPTRGQSPPEPPNSTGGIKNSASPKSHSSTWKGEISGNL